MGVRDIILRELATDNLTDQQVATRNGLNEASVRRTRRELELDGIVEYKTTDYAGRPQSVWGLRPVTPADSASL